MKSERGSYINIIINTRKLKLAYVINIVVELIWNDTEFGKLESSRKLPSLVVWVSAVPHKLMKPVSEKSTRTLHLESVSIICSSLSLSFRPPPPHPPLSNHFTIHLLKVWTQWVHSVSSSALRRSQCPSGRRPTPHWHPGRCTSSPQPTPSVVDPWIQNRVWSYGEWDLYTSDSL